jgi:hypothetical protein
MDIQPTQPSRTALKEQAGYATRLVITCAMSMYDLNKRSEEQSAMQELWNKIQLKASKTTTRAYGDSRPKRRWARQCPEDRTFGGGVIIGGAILSWCYDVKVPSPHAPTLRGQE